MEQGAKIGWTSGLTGQGRASVCASRLCHWYMSLEICSEVGQSHKYLYCLHYRDRTVNAAYRNSCLF